MNYLYRQVYFMVCVFSLCFCHGIINLYYVVFKGTSMYMTENIPDNTPRISRNQNIRFIAQCLFLYAACFLLYYGTSTGQDIHDVSLATRQLIPPMLLFYVVQQISGKTLLSRLWLTQFLTGMSWALTTPLLMYLQREGAPRLDPMADILFGCYAALFLMSAQQLTAGRRHCRLFQSCTTILSQLLMFIPLCQVIHFSLYGTCITEQAIFALRTESLGAYVQQVCTDLGWPMVVGIVVFYYFLGYFIFKFNAKIFISLPTLKRNASVLIFFLTFVILAVYLPKNLIPQTYFFRAWHQTTKVMEQQIPDGMDK